MPQVRHNALWRCPTASQQACCTLQRCAECNLHLTMPHHWEAGWTQFAHDSTPKLGPVLERAQECCTKPSNLYAQRQLKHKYKTLCADGHSDDKLARERALYDGCVRRKAVAMALGPGGGGIEAVLGRSSTS